MRRTRRKEEKKDSVGAYIQFLTKSRSIFWGAQAVAQPLERRHSSVDLEHTRC